MEEAKFYRAFEDSFRGDRSVIKRRLTVYLPFIEPLKDMYQRCEAVDLGCGRGEWLELMSEAGFDARGVDIDEGMLAACRELGLNASKLDALSYLKALPDNSVAVVSGFHIAEHLQFAYLRETIREGLRVLVPSGILILETPNPENIVVGSNNFYFDPSHERPIPSQLLSFLTGYTGFYRSKIVRLQEPKKPGKTESINLHDVLEGVSPDYAVIAQKEDAPEKLISFNEIFDKDFGISLGAMTAGFEDRLQSYEAFFRQVEQSALETHKKTIEAVRTAQQAMERSRRAMEHSRQAMERSRQAENKAAELYNQLNAVHASTSWKLTKPVRIAGDVSKWFVRGSIAWLTFAPGSRPWRALKGLILPPDGAPQSKLKCMVRRVFLRFPGLRERLENDERRLAAAHSAEHQNQDEVTDSLYPGARKIYMDLKSAIEKNYREGD